MISINELLVDHQEFHSDLQMDSFITVRSGGTLYGCYKQALRELNTRKTALIQRYTQIKISRVDCREREQPGKTEFDTERNTIRNEEYAAFLLTVEQALQDTLREAAHFYGQAIAIRQLMESQGISFPLNNATRNQLDCEMWEHHLKGRCAIDLMSAGRLGNTTIELIQSCPIEMKQRISRSISQENHAALVDWFMDFNLELPTPIKIETTEVQRLIGCST